MSQSNPDNLERYRGTTGAEVKTADVSGSGHALKQALGEDDSSKERIYDPKIAGERFVQFYDDSAAAIREYLSNAETACIRRCRQELLDAGYSKDEIPGEVTDLIALAKEETGYEPLIEVTYRRKSDETRLVIEDNGIGISTQEYKVVQRIGYSASHMEGNRLGNFGMGWMSGFQLTSIDGVFKMSTKSYMTDEAYTTQEYVANCEYLDTAPQEYGTRFEFPSFGEEAKSIDIPRKVSEFAEGMRITVLYRDFDSSGQETFRSDDFLPTNLEDAYDDDSMVVIYENEYFKAVMSPSYRSGSYKTYNITMPIRRNLDSWSSNDSFDAPWQWDFRAKREDGPIVSCDSDESVVGMIPKEDSKYDRLIDEFKEKCIPMSEVPDDAITMPEPASSRDSFMGGNDEFWKHVSQCLNESWAEIASERFEELTSWDAFLDMERDEKEAVFRAYNQFGPSYSDTTKDTIVETIEDNLGVTIDGDLGIKLHESKSSVDVVRRNSNNATRKNATTRKKIWEVIDEAPDGVYMAKSPSQKKADIVWGLGETHVVRLDKRSYDVLEDAWGWKKAKDLPHRKLAEKLPNLDQSVVDKYENGTSSTSSGQTTLTTGGNGQDPTTYRMKVRVGTGSRKYISTWKVSDLMDKLENDDSFSVGRYSATKLVILPDTTSARMVAREADRKLDVAAADVPKYVYEYLDGEENVYTSFEDIRKEKAQLDITLSDGTTMDISDVPETDFIIAAGSRTKEYFESQPERFAELTGYDTDNYERYTFVESSDIMTEWQIKTDATVVKSNDAGYNNTKLSDVREIRKDFDDLMMDDKLEGMDEDSEEYDALFSYRYGEPSGKTLRTLIDIAEQAGLTD